MGTGTIFTRALIFAAVLFGIIAVLGRPVRGQAQLRVGYYAQSCPAAERIVRNKFAVHFRRDPRIAAHLLRVQFHDCAVTGCDASLLLTGSDTEQQSGPNLTLEGFEVLSDIKSRLEEKCPGVVSCADLITMAARDAVFLSGGPFFSVPLGRFDSFTSGGPNVTLPSPSSSVSDAITFFQGIGLSAADMVVLLGGHTIGTAHCSAFTDRLSNFNNTNFADPLLQPMLFARLSASCSNSSSPFAMGRPVPVENVTVPLDLTSEFHFDNHYFHQVRRRNGVLHIDQEIFDHRSTSHVVDLMASSPAIFAKCFAQALIKMGQVGVKDSTQGTIRAQC